MSVNNGPSISMSDDEAKKEHDDIQREIAAKKGYEYKPDGDTTPPDEKEIEKEPVTDDESKGDKSKDQKPDDDDLDPLEDQDVDLETDEDLKPRKRSLLGKYQSTKKERDALDEENKAQAKKIEELTLALNNTQTAEKMKQKVSVYAEKHGMSEEAVMDLLLLQKEAIQPDPDIRTTLEESRALIQQNKAQKAFDNEFAKLVEDVPLAADLRDKIRDEAYKEGNLDKSLFELYHRMEHQAPAPKKRTGEAQRGAPSRETRSEAFNARAVADKVKAGQSGSLTGLSGEQADEVFAILDKEGSRYS